MKNVVLTGFMGVGKTTVGKKLAEKLGMKFVDTDEVIEKEVGKTIIEIFDSDGEKFFREKEAEVFKRMLDEESLVISAGGGAFTNPDLRKCCKGKAVAICLVCSFETLLKRVEELKKSRPLLQNKSVDEIRELYKIRSECYIDCDTCVEVDDLTPDQVVEKILGFVKNL